MANGTIFNANFASADKDFKAIGFMVDIYKPIGISVPLSR